MLYRKNLTFLLFIIVIIIQNINCRSYFGIGSRLIGDQLLCKDDRGLEHVGITEVPRIQFYYSIPEAITYIEILTEEDVYAEVHFSYYDDIVNGTVTPKSANNEIREIFKPFIVSINIYGFNNTVHNLYPGSVLNRGQNFDGILRPFKKNERVEDLDDTLDEDDDDFEDEDDDDITIHEKIPGEEDFDDEDYDFGKMDNFIQLGERQKGDYLLYETYQTSPTTTDHLTNHSAVFYYIDNAYITHIEFVLIDYFVNKTTSDRDENLYIASYSHFTPSTLKAVITDYKTTSIFVKMSVYGYNQADLPIEYVSYIPPKVQKANQHGMTTESPLAVLQRNRLILKGQRFEDTPSVNVDPNAIDDLTKETITRYACSQIGHGGSAMTCTALSTLHLLLAIFGIESLRRFLCTNVL